MAASREARESGRGDQLLRVRNDLSTRWNLHPTRRVLAARVEFARRGIIRGAARRLRAADLDPADALALRGVIDAKAHGDLPGRGLLAPAEKLGRKQPPERIVPVLGRRIFLVRRLGGREPDRLGRFTPD